MSSQMSQFRSSLKNAWRNDRRQLLRSATAWFLFGAIIVVFVFWGLTPQQAGVTQGGTAAQVDGEIVSMAEFAERTEIMSQNPNFAQLEQFGGDFARRYIRQQALQGLVDERLLSKSLQKIGVSTSDAQVRDTITGIQAFQEDGRFSHTRYLSYLQATRQDAGSFEGKIRRQLAAGLAARAFSAALKPIPQESKLLKELEAIKANVEGVSIPTENLVIAEMIPAAQVKEFLAKPDAEARLKTYFETHKDEFVQAEKAKVRHILVRAEKGNADAVAKAKATAEALVKELKAGADFAKLAKEKSEDPGSKENGGLIDFFARGSMVPEFETYAFSAKPGEISAPIQTDFGFHVIRVEERRSAKNPALDDVKEDIAEKLVAQEKTREEIQALEKALVDGQADAVQSFVAKHKLKWTESGNFSVTASAIPKLGGGDEAVGLALKLTAAQPLAKKLVRQGPAALLLKYKAVTADAKVAAKGDAGKTDAGKDAEAAREAQAARRGEEVFGHWVAELRKSAKISIAPEVAQGTQAAVEE
ncbi:MAG: SurA N-terminal domain-containing protein [Bdellovibrionaceae bacterium]|nr:SurA N-terminal domain-containing protein [Pseudobdellovibrionaceae bacterium]